MKTMKLVTVIVVAAGMLLSPSVAKAELLTPMPPSAGNFNFCLAFDTLEATFTTVVGILGGFLEPEDIAVFVDISESLTCEAADINGPLDLEADFPVTANGLLDAEYELGVLAFVANADSYSNSAGLTQSAVLAAFDTNYTFLLGVINDALASTGYDVLITPLAPDLVPSLTYVLAGYATLGDANSVGALSAVFGLLEQIGITPPDTSNLDTSLAGLLGFDGDADGDEVDNRGEYNAYWELGPSTYIANALNDSVFPEIVGLFPGFPLSGPTNWVAEGTNVILGIGGGLSAEGAATYAWTHDGTPVGGNLATLALGAVDLAASGLYVLGITDESKGSYTSAPFNLNVVEAGEVPVAGGLGITLLAGVCALAGAVGIRRKR